jgi:hypothetical protein
MGDGEGLLNKLTYKKSSIQRPKNLYKSHNQVDLVCSIVYSKKTFHWQETILTHLGGDCLSEFPTPTRKQQIQLYNNAQSLQSTSMLNSFLAPGSLQLLPNAAKERTPKTWPNHWAIDSLILADLSQSTR